MTGARWPAYALPAMSPLRAALLNSAAALGINLTPKIADPANIGDYLAGLGVPATAGYGVEYRALHATDERINLASIPPAQAVYHAAITLLTSG